MHRLAEFYLKPRVHYVLWTLGWAILGVEQVFLHTGVVMICICGLVMTLAAVAAVAAWKKPDSS
jgi:hypothetical protein